MDTLDSLLAALIGGSVSGGLLMLAARTVFSQFLQKNLERYKIELKAEQDKHLEVLRAELRVAASQKETRFTTLHARRVDVMIDMFAKMMTAHLAHQKLLTTQSEASVDAAFIAGQDFLSSAWRARVVLPRELAEQVSHFGQVLWHAYVDLTIGNDKLERWRQVRATMEEKVQPLRDAIEVQIRKELGEDE